MYLLPREGREVQAGNRRESRREWLERMLALGLTGSALARATSTHGVCEKTKWSAPGLFPGRVVRVEHPGSIISGAYQREPVEQMIKRGMMELTGAPDSPSAWRAFFEPSDIVGIKLNPVSRPYVVSAPEVVQTIVAGLESAGVPRKNIVAYDRYRQEFYAAGFDKWLPEGVRIAWAADYNDRTQQRIDGYDPDHYMDMQLTLPGFDLSNDRARRSYAAFYITKDVNKLVNLCLLKHHQSAGITFALKNLSHGLVNNVNRSHSSPMLNACGAFIPASVSIPVIRNKAVLHIGDAIKALAHGGPVMNPRRQKYVWEHKTMFFSTDPVAIDKIGWEELDARRVAIGMKPLAEALLDEDSGFVRMQPEHVEIAGALGLGVAEKRKIDLRSIKLS
ncbi:MAG: DUF362 domain-containing protein [Bryobacteraceae bacterium]|nr:DUF362 domain-containing protein [Bryobacteraceae bacterium]